jgi:hypothetical protein
VGDSRIAAEGDNKSPEKEQKHSPEGSAESFRFAHHDNHPHESRLSEQAASELDRGGHSLFTRLKGELTKGLVDLETGTEELLKSVFGSHAHRDREEKKHHPAANPDGSHQKPAEGTRDPGQKTSEPGSTRKADANAVDQKTARDGAALTQKQSEVPSGSDGLLSPNLTAAPEVKTVKVQTIRVTNADAAALNTGFTPGAFAPGTDSTLSVSRFQPVKAEGDKTVNAETKVTPAGEVPTTVNAVPVQSPLEPKPVKTIAIHEPAPDMSSWNTFQPASTFSAGPDATRFTPSGQAPDAGSAERTTRSDAAAYSSENITILKVRPVEPEKVLSSPNVLDSTPAQSTIEPRVVKTVAISGPAPGMAEAMTFQPSSTFNAGPDTGKFTRSDSSAVTSKDAADARPAQTSEPNITILKVKPVSIDSAPNSAAMNNIIFDPTPIAQQKVMTAAAAPAGSESTVRDQSACSTPAGELKPITLADVQAAVYGDRNKTAPAEQPAIPNDVLFNPTPIAQQQLLLAGNPNAGRESTVNVATSKEARAAMDAIVFDPTPIAQQKYTFSGSTSTAARDDANCTLAGPLKPFTLADIHAAVYGDQNPTAPAKKETIPDSVLFDPTPIAQQKVLAGGDPATTRDTGVPTGKEARAAMDNIVFNPTSIANQQLMSGGDKTVRADNSFSTPAGTLKPITLADVHAAVYGDQNGPSGLKTDSGTERAKGVGSQALSEGGDSQVKTGGGARDTGLFKSGQGGDAVSSSVSARGGDDGALSSRSSARSSGDESSGRSHSTGSGGSDAPASIRGLMASESSSVAASGFRMDQPRSGLADTASVTVAQKAVDGQKQAAEAPKQDSDSAVKKSRETEQVVRYIVSAISQIAGENSQKPAENVSMGGLANVLARSAQPLAMATPLESVSGKTVPAGDREAASASAGRLEIMSGPVSLSALTAKFAAGAEASTGSQQAVAGRLGANAEAAAVAGALSSPVGNAALVPRSPGAAAAEAAIVNALAGGKGVFAATDLGTAGRGMAVDFGPAGKGFVTGIDFGPAGKGAVAGIDSGMAGRNPVASLNPSTAASLVPGYAGAVRGTAGGAVFTDASGRTMRVDPFTGQIIVAVEAQTGKALSLSEMQRVRKVLGERRYLTGVEIAIACALASAAVAKARNNGTPEGDEASEDLKQLYDDALLPGGSVDPSRQNVFKRHVHMVAHNDSLVDIAEQLFQDADVAWLIADINAGRITEHYEDGKRIVELRSRQEIELPFPSEVRDFLLTRDTKAKAENLVTIVGVTEIDRELLDSFLCTVVGGEKQATAAPVPEAVGPAPAPALQPLMQLVDFGRNFGKSLLPSMSAIVGKGLNLRTYISKVETVASPPPGNL